ncbi:nucleoside triphosphate pyrophosphohydrolase [Sedimenticola thiotaurini]|uniref:Nucleoside triphosphate pyrophosphohydrolase n=1 Tax=Sedimenticola thiotaurini TaxID=1543721 RepID=A0A0F7JWY4_9GAMM|nr:nucleoside triphosphate pyrophosphohydrolase [Sedimenticola thiotaurini]AKH19093.1 nucleoside triphosphate hydrolase [Sedimenticola thiotaurini]
MSIKRLVDIMAELRDPEHGCPWDREQVLESLVPYTIEEAYEVADSIARGDMEELCGELGDLLFQVVFYARIASEQGQFDMQDVIDGICEKMVRRHPHVFGDQSVADAQEQSLVWEQLKAQERQNRAGERTVSHLDGIAQALPALLRAGKLQKRAAKVGFDWPESSQVLEKVKEELQELEAELQGPQRDQARIAEEMGDLLFSCVNLSRHLGLEAEGLLRSANSKFETRFNAMETTLLRRGVTLESATLSVMDATWDEIKQKEADE